MDRGIIRDKLSGLSILTTVIALLSGCGISVSEIGENSAGGDQSTGGKDGAKSTEGGDSTVVRAGSKVYRIDGLQSFGQTKVDQNQDGTVTIQGRDVLGDKFNMEVSPDGKVRMSGKDFLGNKGRVETSNDGKVQASGRDFLGNEGKVEASTDGKVQIHGRDYTGKEAKVDVISDGSLRVTSSKLPSATADDVANLNVSGSGKASMKSAKEQVTKNGAINDSAIVGSGTAVISDGSETVNISGNWSTKVRSEVTYPIGDTGIDSSIERLVEDFTGVANSTAAAVTVKVGSRKAVRLTGDANIIPLIETSSDGKILSIRATKAFLTKRPLRIEVEVPHLNSVKLAGSGELKASGLNEEQLDIVLSGSNEATINGFVRKLACRVTGSGEAHLKALKTDVADIDVAGSGEVEVFASKVLNATITGSGSIRHAGNATVHSTVTGSGRVSPL